MVAGCHPLGCHLFLPGQCFFIDQVICMEKNTRCQQHRRVALEGIARSAQQIGMRHFTGTGPAENLKNHRLFCFQKLPVPDPALPHGIPFLGLLPRRHGCVFFLRLSFPHREVP